MEPGRPLLDAPVRRLLRDRHRQHPLAAGRAVRDERARHGHGPRDDLQLGCVPFLSIPSSATTTTTSITDSRTRTGGNLIIGSTFLSLIDAISPAGAFGFYAGLCFLGSVFVFFLYPETSGLSLEETREVFKDGYGIKKANRMRAQKAQALAQVRAEADGIDA